MDAKQIERLIANLDMTSLRAEKATHELRRLGPTPNHCYARLSSANRPLKCEGLKDYCET